MITIPNESSVSDQNIKLNKLTENKIHIWFQANLYTSHVKIMHQWPTS